VIEYLKELQGTTKAGDGNCAGSDNGLHMDEHTIKTERDVDTKHLAEKRRRERAKTLFKELRSLVGANLTEAGKFDRNSILLHTIQLIQKLTGKDENSKLSLADSSFSSLSESGSSCNQGLGAAKFQLEQAEMKNKKKSPNGEASNLPREERKMRTIIRQIEEMEHMAKAVKKRSKADETESDPEVEDLSRDVGSITNNTAVSVQEQCGKKCKTEIRKIRVFPAGGSEQKKKYSVSIRKVAGGATNPRIACDDCRKKRIRCVHMAAAAIALGVSIKNTQKHAKDQNARNGSTIGGSGIGDVGKSAPLTAQVEIM